MNIKKFFLKYISTKYWKEHEQRPNKIPLSLMVVKQMAIRVRIDNSEMNTIIKSRGIFSQKMLIHLESHVDAFFRMRAKGK